MKYKLQAKTIAIILVAIFCLRSLAVAKELGGGPNPDPHPSPDPSGVTLDLNEDAHLKSMRAEEKLAHDVYKYLDNYLDAENPVYPFASIVESESNHVASMADKIRIYGLEDINADDAEGEFDPGNYGEYLQALMVGGLIEELDMHDIILCPSAIQDAMYIGEEDCGMEYADEDLLKDSYENLFIGSEIHLRPLPGQLYLNMPTQQNMTILVIRLNTPLAGRGEYNSGL